MILRPPKSPLFPYTTLFRSSVKLAAARRNASVALLRGDTVESHSRRSEEHTSELQSHLNIVCPLLLSKEILTQLHASSRTKYSSQLGRCCLAIPTALLHYLQ